jgi:hypothetical protein
MSLPLLPRPESVKCRYIPPVAGVGASGTTWPTFTPIRRHNPASLAVFRNVLVWNRATPKADDETADDQAVA